MGGRQRPGPRALSPGAHLQQQSHNLCFAIERGFVQGCARLRLLVDLNPCLQQLPGIEEGKA